jgi:hypothetical protein
MEQRLARRTSSPSFAGRALALVIAAVLLMVNGPGATASSVPAPSTPEPGFAAVQSDPIGELAWALDYDVDRIFRFVADEIRYEPYPGILRGAHGTLHARAGNSLDKALLLAALLDVSQIPYRFARGSLDAGTAARIIDSMATDLVGARQAALDPLERGLDQLTAAASPAPESNGPLAALYEQQEQQLAAEGAERLEVARSRLGDTVTMLSDALGGAGIHLSAGTGVSLPEAETGAHTWVQMRHGATWMDLDATLAAGQPGTVLTPASETLDQLPDDLRYRVRFDVLVERAQGGQLVTDSLLTDEGFADQLAGVPVMFSHVTPSSLKRLGVALNALLGEGWIDYRPTLALGERSLVADDAVAFPMADRGTDIFGSDTSPGAGPADGEATAEWLQVTVTPPGSQPEIARRTVFDRLPADVRHGGAITVDAVEPISLVDLDGSGSADYPPMRGVEAFVIATGPTSAAPVITGSGDGLGMFALAYHHVRDAMDVAMALDTGARTFIDGPNIVSVSVDLDQDATAPDIGRHMRIGLDIWLRSHGSLPLTGSSMTPATAQIVAGATDHLAERFALEQFAGARGAPPGEIGVGAVFEAAVAQGVPTVVLHGTVPDSLPYGPEAKGSIAAAVAAGDVVVIPAEPVTIDGTQRVGWWAIDPETGATRDSMDDGSGAAAVEYETTVQTRLGQIKCYGALGATIAAELAWVVNVQLLNLRSLNTFSQLRRARQMGVCA